MKFVLVLAFMLHLAAFGFATDYLFAHCWKSDGDWDYIQPDWCTNYGAQDWACNSACPNKNARYCLFDDAHKTQLCKFKEWCEKDGYTAKAKLCAYTASMPSHCSEDRVIEKYTFGNITECTTIYTGA